MLLHVLVLLCLESSATFEPPCKPNSGPALSRCFIHSQLLHPDDQHPPLTNHTEWQPGWTPAPCKDLHQPPAIKPRKTQQLITDDTVLIKAYHTHSLTVGGSDTRGPQLCTCGLNKLWNIYYLNEKQVFSQHPRPGHRKGKLVRIRNKLGVDSPPQLVPDVIKFLHIFRVENSHVVQALLPPTTGASHRLFTATPSLPAASGLGRVTTTDPPHARASTRRSTGGQKKREH